MEVIRFNSSTVQRFSSDWVLRKGMRILCAVALSLHTALAQTPAGPSVRGETSKSSLPVTSTPASAPQTYILSPSDVVQVKVYQEDDLESRLRIARDGTTSFPLIGVIKLGGKTVEQASNLIRDELAKDFLVNPQVTLTVIEYAKRRFTVLGQVQRPGAYEIPNEESVTLLQAIAMAGGYTRLANKANITVTRSVNGKKATFSLDVNHATNDLKTEPFAILPEDTITVPERLF